MGRNLSEGKRAQFRDVTIEDARLLFNWRNDPEARKQSLSTDEIHWETHLGWVTRSLLEHRKTRKLLIFEDERVPLGTVRFEKVATGWELSWNVAPEARGRGVGKRMLTLAVELMLSYDLTAKIRQENLASKAIAEKAGFRFSHSDQEVEIWMIRRSAVTS